VEPLYLYEMYFGVRLWREDEKKMRVF